MAQTLPKVMGVEFNYETKAVINTTPTGAEATYSDMTAAFKNIATALNESVYSAAYLSDGGYSSQLVTGISPTVTLTGDFIKGDPVCEFLDRQQWEPAAGRVTDIKITRNGRQVAVPVTLTAIAIAGGDTAAPNSVTVTIAFNGKPTITDAVTE